MAGGRRGCRGACPGDSAGPGTGSRAAQDALAAGRDPACGGSPSRRSCSPRLQRTGTPRESRGTTEHTRRVLLHQNTKSVEGGPCKNKGDQGGWALGRHPPGSGLPGPPSSPRCALGQVTCPACLLPPCWLGLRAAPPSGGERVLIQGLAQSGC